MTRKVTSFRLTVLATRQLAELTSALAMNNSEVVSTAIDRMFQQETKLMNTKLTDSQLDDITFGPGLYATYHQNYTAYADSDRDESKLYANRYQHEQMPPFKTERFASEEELTAAMLDIAPLDKWKTIELDDDE